MYMAFMGTAECTSDKRMAEVDYVYYQLQQNRSPKKKRMCRACGDAMPVPVVEEVDDGGECGNEKRWYDRPDGALLPSSHQLLSKPGDEMLKICCRVCCELCVQCCRKYGNSQTPCAGAFGFRYVRLAEV